MKWKSPTSAVFAKGQEILSWIHFQSIIDVDGVIPFLQIMDNMYLIGFWYSLAFLNRI